MSTPAVAVLVLAVAVAAFALGMLLVNRRNEAARAAAAANPDYSDRMTPADQLSIGLLVLDQSGRIAASNRSAEEMLDSRPGSLIGKSTIEAFIDHEVEDLVAAARREGRASGEHTIAGEPQRTVSVHAWSSDRGTLWVALQDVSELRRLRRIRTEFIDNLSHELRTPLSTVRLLTESLSIEAERTELPPRMRESIGKIDVETGHLVQMVNELLDLAKIEQGDAPLRHDEVDMGSVVDDTLARLRTYAERQKVTLREQVVGESDARKVVGDEVRLGQLVANLVHNAIKFSPPNDEVVVHLRPDATSVVLEVEDHGPGIASADRNRIFERFYKVDRARSRGSGGTGLGLAIARHIVERHGGHIWVQSEEGKGARFFVSLPREARP